MSTPIFNRAALLPGMGISRMTPGAISRAIVLRTQGIRPLFDGTGISHDGKLIRTGNSWFVGDMLMGKPGQLTPLEQWEEEMEYHGVRAVVHRAVGATDEQLAASAWYWQTHFVGKVQYDEKGIRQLLFFYATAEILKIKLGDENSVWCTESCRDSDVKGGGFNPYRKPNCGEKINPTPGTTRKRIVGPWKTIDVVREAFTEAGRRFEITM